MLSYKYKNDYLLKGCSCHSDGSDGACDVTGKCTCKNENIAGDKCDTCVENYYGFPTCDGKYRIFFVNKSVLHL